MVAPNGPRLFASDESRLPINKGTATDRSLVPMSAPLGPLGIATILKSVALEVTTLTSVISCQGQREYASPRQRTQHDCTPDNAIYRNSETRCNERVLIDRLTGH